VRKAGRRIEFGCYFWGGRVETVGAVVGLDGAGSVDMRFSVEVASGRG
jgi:hypothetical protein